MIRTPTLILDENRCHHNIRMMVEKARRHNLSFRPHFKTHQSLEIGRWFREYGVEKITVSSLAMANYFAADWNDITIAFPVNIQEINEINALAKRINLQLLVESTETIHFLAEQLQTQVGIYLKIDVGYHRTGIAPDNIELQEAIINVCENNSQLNFQGFLAHAGHSYKARSHAEIQKIHDQALAILTNLKTYFQPHFPNLIISLGDTPSCSIADNFPNIDEIRPGNFVFYDLTQNQISSNSIGQIAVAMACPIVAIHKGRNEIVVYGGGVHFSKDRLEDDRFGTIFGKVVRPEGNTWGDIIPDMYVKSLSQEHGIIVTPAHLIDNYKVGDHLLVLPIHSCMAANAMKAYQTTNGKKISRL